MFDGYSATEPVIANLTEATGEKVNILSANTKSVGGVGFGQMIIEIPKEPASAEKVLQYLGQTGIVFSEIEREEDAS